MGLYPIQIREIRSLIRELSNDHGVILSTHILPEVQMTCDRVQIINKGKLVFSDQIENLNQRMQSGSLLLGLHQPPEPSELSKINGVTNVEVLDDNLFRISHSTENSPAETIAEQAVKNSWGLFELSPERKTLEQIFVDITSTEHTAEEHAA